MSWVADSSWWQVYPLGALGADTTGADRTSHRTLSDLVPWLDYAIDLGVNGLALGPVFASATHGYDTTDHYAIDERLGTIGDFDRLVEQCRRRGLRVMLDGVFNHVGRQHPIVQELLRDGTRSESAGLLRVSRPPGGGPELHTFEGHPGLVTLDHDSPAVQDLVVDVMCHWLDRGADAWRLDAAYAVPTAFWSAVLTRVRARHPEAYVLGEVIHGDYAQFVAESGVDAVTQYELWKAIWSSLNDRNLFELAHALGRHNGFLDTFVPWTFVGNHDVTRLATQLSEPRHLAHALVVLATVGGTPAIYYGDEQGMTGRKEDRVGGDDAVRPALPDAPGSLPPAGKPAYRLHQELLGLRRRHRWLHRATTEVLQLDGEQVAYRSFAGDRALVVALNLAEGPAVVTAGPARRRLAGVADLQERRIRLPAHGWAVYDAE